MGDSLRAQQPQAEFEGFEDLAGNHQLAALPYAADSFLDWGCLHDTYYVWTVGQLSV
jgi:hypothetical protein